MTRLIDHFVDGKPLGDTPERTGDVYDPATGEVAAQVALASPEVVDRAVRTARAAFDEWREVPLGRRAQILFAYREILDSRRDELARSIVAEHGKVLADAMGELARGIEVVEFACGIPHLMKGEFSENVSRAVDSYSLRQPLGVVAGVTPFNFPAMVPMWMFPVAVACGNSFVLKPSERDPSTPNLLAEWFVEAGLPAGVFNVVHGDKVAVDALLDHPEVAAISSVGSTPVARYIYERAAEHGKRVQALGGAKNHMVVLPDADMELAADSLVASAYGSTGQRCMAISAVVTVGAAGDELLDFVKERVSNLKVGPGLAEDADMGPLVTGQHRDKVLSLIQSGVEEGATLAIDGRNLELEGYEDGFFLGPCLFDNVTPEMAIYKEEIFGPVPVMLRAESFEDAIDIVNSNPYGNGTAVFTNDGGAARKFQREIEVGMVGVNVPIPVPMAFYSFGGWGDSLFGDSNVHGTEGVRFYSRTKTVTSRWPNPEQRGVDLGFPRNE